MMLLTYTTVSVRFRHFGRKKKWSPTHKRTRYKYYYIARRLRFISSIVCNESLFVNINVRGNNKISRLRRKVSKNNSTPFYNICVLLKIIICFTCILCAKKNHILIFFDYIGTVAFADSIFTIPYIPRTQGGQHSPWMIRHLSY